MVVELLKGQGTVVFEHYSAERIDAHSKVES